MMRAALAASIFVLLVGCDSPTEPTAPPQGTFRLDAAAPSTRDLSNTEWQPLPFTYTRTRCDFSIDSGSITYENWRYTLVLKHTTSCPEVIPAVIEESGTFTIARASLALHADRGQCGRSWLIEAFVREGAVEAALVHPCLSGTVRYLRFLPEP